MPTTNSQVASATTEARKRMLWYRHRYFVFWLSFVFYMFWNTPEWVDFLGLVWIKGRTFSLIRMFYTLGGMAFLWREWIAAAKRIDRIRDDMSKGKHENEHSNRE